MARAFFALNAVIWVGYGLYCFFVPSVLADAAAFPALSFTQKFRDEFIEHVRLKRCPFRRVEAAARRRVSGGLHRVDALSRAGHAAAATNCSTSSLR